MSEIEGVFVGAIGLVIVAAMLWAGWRGTRWLELQAGGPWKLAGWLLVADILAIETLPRRWMVGNVIMWLLITQVVRLLAHKHK